MGVGVSLYGANKQAKDTAHAQDLNKQSFDSQQLSNWNQYLMQRGINPTGNTEIGGFGSAQPINSKLPIWAYVDRSGPGNPKLIARSPNAGMPTTAETATAPVATDAKGNRLLNALDPLGIIGGDKPSVKRALDPFGFF